MLRILFRIVFFPLIALMLLWLSFRNRLALGKSGVMKIELDGSKSQKEPLWPMALVRAASGSRVKRVHLEIQPAAWGWADLQAIRGAILQIREQGTPVYASLEAGDNAGIFLSSACDKTFLSPLGEVFLGGVAIQMRFLGDAMERLGLQFEVVSAGDYKSAAEPLSRSFPSQANREALDELVSDLHAGLRRSIAEGRGVDEGRLQEIMEDGLLSGEAAIEEGLVDSLAYPKAMEGLLEKELGGKPKFVDADVLVKRDARRRKFKRLFRKSPKIKVLHFHGPIARDSPKYNRKSRITQKESLEAIEALVETPPDAAVLVVDSPGGSALVSDLIWESVVRLTEKCPVVACFQNISASGGYYISAGCREIVASESSITGSIGVISGKLVTGRALAKWGVHMDRIAGAAGSDLLSGDRPLTSEQRLILKRRIQEIYATFKNRVEVGRGLSPEAVEESAQGRVWTGRQAKERALVDHLGGVPVALERSAVLAEIDLREARVFYQKVQKKLPIWAKFMTTETLPVEAYFANQLCPVAQTMLEHPAEALAIWPVSGRVE